jgi:hypothetical protein
MHCYSIREIGQLYALGEGIQALLVNFLVPSTLSVVREFVVLLGNTVMVALACQSGVWDAVAAGGGAMMTDIGNIRTDLIARVRDVLEARAAEGRLVSYIEIEREIGQTISSSQWHTILDPIYDECMAIGDPDLSAIVVYDDTRYPLFFSQGKKVRSVRFNPDRHLEQWQGEVARVFATWKERRGT